MKFKVGTLYRIKEETTWLVNYEVGAELLCVGFGNNAGQVMAILGSIWIYEAQLEEVLECLEEVPQVSGLTEREVKELILEGIDRDKQLEARRKDDLPPGKIKLAAPLKGVHNEILIDSMIKASYSAEELIQLKEAGLL